jgi:hypothetical protein
MREAAGAVSLSPQTGSELVHGALGAFVELGGVWAKWTWSDGFNEREEEDSVQV